MRSPAVNGTTAVVLLLEASEHTHHTPSTKKSCFDDNGWQRLVWRAQHVILLIRVAVMGVGHRSQVLSYHPVVNQVPVHYTL